MVDRHNIHFEDDFDYGLEWCEEILIESWDRRAQEQKEARDAIADLSKEETKRLSDLQAKFDELTVRLAHHAEVVDFKEGQMMVEIGSYPRGLQLLVSGLATAHDGQDHHRLRNTVPAPCSRAGRIWRV